MCFSNVKPHQSAGRQVFGAGGGGGGRSRVMSACLDTGCLGASGGVENQTGRLDTHGRVSPTWAPSEAGSNWAGGCHLQSPSGMEPLESSRLLSISATVLREARVFTFMS